MIFYRITLNLAFTHQDAIEDIKDKALDHFPDAFTINPGQPTAEQSFITLQECFHGQDPTTPCITLEHHETPP